jgi:zinc transport system ATP-binding protein
MANIVIRGEGISFKYGSNTVLDNCSFKVQNGDFAVVIGPNGSGKSTLLKICLGLLNPHSGEIRLYEKPINEFEDWNKIGYVPQRINSFNQGFPATVEEVVRAPLYVNSNLFSVSKDNYKEYVGKVLTAVGMEGYGNRLIGKLSTGQQQRVFIAKALVNNPSILFMDEPTAGIDNKSEEDFYNLLFKLNKQQKITIVMVTHDYTDVKPMVNRVIHLHNGNVMEQSIFNKD